MKRTRRVKEVSSPEEWELPKEPTKPKAVGFIGTIIIIAVAFVLGNLFGKWFFTTPVGMNIAIQIASLRRPQSPQPVSQQPSSTNSGTKTAPPVTMITLGGKEYKQPTEESSKEEQDTFSNAVKAAAVEADAVSVDASCKLTPQVTKVRYSKTITVKNTGKTDVTLNFGDKAGDLTVKAGGQSEFKAALKGPGVYHVSCGTGTAGFLQITEAVIQ